jgi:hypothetical protein
MLRKASVTYNLPSAPELESVSPREYTSSDEFGLTLIFSTSDASSLPSGSRSLWILAP